MSKIEAGTYKAHGIEGSARPSTSSKGSDQVVLDLILLVPKVQVSTFLYFTPAAEKYSLDRLRALGWNGDGDDPTFKGIGTNEVDVQIRYETFEGKEQMKVEIWTGGGTVTVKAPMAAQEVRSFVKRLAKDYSQAPATGAAPAGPSSAGGGGKVAL